VSKHYFSLILLIQVFYENNTINVVKKLTKTLFLLIVDLFLEKILLHLNVKLYNNCGLVPHDLISSTFKF